MSRRGPARAVLLCGGPNHDFRATGRCLGELLGAAGLAVDLHEDVQSAFAALPGAALLVVNALRWRMTGPGTPGRYRAIAAAEGVSPSPSARAALGAHLAAGGGVLAMHTAVICFDDWPAWADTLGGAWAWGRSQHPPIGPAVTVRPAGDHPLVEGVPPFEVVDEVYGDLALAPDVHGLLAAAQPGAGGAVCPLLWAREHGGGRVVVDTLGHDPSSFAVPAHRKILDRAVRWLVGGPLDDPDGG